MFVYQLTLATLVKKGKGTDYALSWKSKQVYTSKLKPLCIAFLLSIKLSGYQVEIKFDQEPVAVEQNNATKIINAYIFYHLDNWPNLSPINYTLKYYLLGVTTIIKTSDKEGLVCSGHGIAFDRKSRWNYGNDFARNIVIFGVDNSSSSHADNRKNNFLVLGEGPTYGITGSFDSPEKKFRINFKKSKVKILLAFAL